MADVKKRHRVAALTAWFPSCNWGPLDLVWFEAGSSHGYEQYNRVAQALADAEQRGAESAKAEAQPEGLAKLRDAWQRYQRDDLSQSEFEGTVAEIAALTVGPNPPPEPALTADEGIYCPDISAPAIEAAMREAQSRLCDARHLHGLIQPGYACPECGFLVAVQPKPELDLRDYARSLKPCPSKDCPDLAGHDGDCWKLGENSELGRAPQPAAAPKVPPVEERDWFHYVERCVHKANMEPHEPALDYALDAIMAMRRVIADRLERGGEGKGV